MSKRNLTWTWVLVEIGIVVTGIVIAFSVDSWWDGRVAAEQEQAHLQALLGDFERNVEQLEELVDLQGSVSEASQRLLLIARRQSAASPDSVERLMGEVFSSDRFDATMGAYENLVNSGGLAQIRDDTLRASLASFAAMLDSRYQEEFSTAVYLDFVRAFVGRLGWANAVLQDELNRGGSQPEEAMTRWNHDLLDDPVFLDHLALRFVAERQVGGMYASLARQAHVVLDRIRTLLH